MERPDVSHFIESATNALERELTKDETDRINAIYNGLKNKKMSSKEFSKRVARNFGEYIRQKEESNSLIEVRDTLRKEIVENREAAIKYNFNVNYAPQESIQTEPVRPIKQKYVFLHYDSFDRIIDSTSNEYRVDFNDFIGSKGGVEFIGDVANINQIKIYDFRIPIIDEAQNFYNRVYVLIKEFREQSYIIDQQKRYHFICKTTLETNTILLQPLEDFWHFEFAKPYVTRPSTLTIQLFTNDVEIPLPIDRVGITWNSASGAVPTEFLTDSPHGLRTGDVVFFNDIDLSTTTDPSIQELLEAPAGLNATKVSNTIFSVVLPGNTITTAQWNSSHTTAGLDPYVKLGSKRIILNIRMGYVN